MRKIKKEKSNYRKDTAKRKDDVICYVSTEVVLCR